MSWALLQHWRELPVDVAHHNHSGEEKIVQHGVWKASKWFNSYLLTPPGVVTTCCIIVGCPVCWLITLMFGAAGRTGVCFVLTFDAFANKLAFWFMAVCVETELAGRIWAPCGSNVGALCCVCWVLGAKPSDAGRTFCCVVACAMLPTREISIRRRNGNSWIIRRLKWKAWLTIVRWLNGLLCRLSWTLLNEHARRTVRIGSSNEDRISEDGLWLNSVGPEWKLHSTLKWPRWGKLHRLTAQQLSRWHRLRDLNTLLIGLLLVIGNGAGDCLLLLCRSTLRHFLKNLLGSHLLLAIRLCRRRLGLHRWQNALLVRLLLLLWVDDSIQRNRTEHNRLRLTWWNSRQCVTAKARLASTRQHLLATC